MDLGAALNNLAAKISGGNTENVGSSSNTKSASQLKREVETTIGEQLSGNSNKAESAKNIEEKTSAAIDDLMEKLGLSGSKEDSEKTLLEAGKIDISIIDKEELIKKLEINPNSIDLNKLPDDLFKKVLEEDEDDDATFSLKERIDFIQGEMELGERIEEAIKNNPDADPAEIEKEIREAYALENPAHAEAKAEVDAENEKYDAAHKEASDNYVNENPVPEMGNFDSVEDFNKAMDEWQANYESHMADFEEQYKEDNPKYKDVKSAENLLELLKKEGDSPIYIDDPIIKKEPVHTRFIMEDSTNKEYLDMVEEKIEDSSIKYFK